MEKSTASNKLVSLSLSGLLTKTLIFLGVVYLIVFSSYMEGPLNPILLSVLLVFYLLTRSKGQLGIEIPALIFMLVLILTSLTSIDPRRSFYQVWLIGIGIFIIFVVARLIQSGFSSRHLVNFLLILGLGFMLFSWLDAGRWYMTWRASYPEQWIPGISYRLNGGNTIAAYYHGILMIGIGRLVHSRSRVERLTLGAYCLSAALLIFLSSSRGAYLSVAGGMGFLVVLRWDLFKAWILTFHTFFKRHRLILIGIGIVGIVIVAGVAMWYLGNMQSHPTHGKALQSRNEFWGPGWDAFLRSPWIGNGPYTFAIEFMKSTSVPPTPIFYHAHSAYLDILSGSGLLGLFASAGLALTLTYQLWRKFRNPMTQQLSVVLGALLALSSFLIHNVFDGLYLMPFAAFNLCILLGVALGERDEAPRKGVSFPIGLGVTVVMLAWANYWMASPYQNALRAAKEGNYELAGQQFKLSTQRDPRLVLTHQQNGLLDSILASEGDAEALDRAIESFERVVDLDPAYSPNLANLGALYRARGDLELSVDAFKRAIDLAPRWATLHLNLGEVNEMQNLWVLSEQSYIHALSLKPGWMSDGFWTMTAFRQEILTRWQDSDEATLDEEAQYTENDVINQASVVPILKVAAQKLESGDLQAAVRLLGIAPLAYFPWDAQTLELNWLKAELAATEGDWSTAVLQGELALDGYRLQGAYGPGSAGSTSYGSEIFRRNIMLVELVPQLSHVYLPDPWPARMVLLSVWHLENGDRAGCENILNELFMMSPNITEHHPEPELGCQAE